LSSTIGIAVYPDDGTTAPELFNHADIALHQLRQEGHNQYQFYNTRFSTEARFQIRLEQLLEQAIAKKQFHLRYQPQLDLQTGLVTGLEAFLRWEHPEVGEIAPSKIIPLAAQSSLIFEISDWVLRQACQHNRAWQKDRLPPVPVSVNLCRQEFYRQELATVVAKILNETGLDPRWLELEITEAVLRHDPPSAKKSLRDLRNLGVRIALDDFGTGASSLGFITQFDLQTVKLDQQLIRNMRGLPQEKALIAAIVALGQGFQCRVVAEGLEGEAQLQMLQQLHCPQAQGYWFSPPLKAKDVTLFLQQRQNAAKGQTPG
jgi:EAL domain-containing protein (putative c-di-GMP-specific phosphodiesterase class I)